MARMNVMSGKKLIKVPKSVGSARARAKKRLAELRKTAAVADVTSPVDGEARPRKTQRLLPSLRDLRAGQPKARKPVSELMRQLRDAGR
ncbi:MAG TPA: hypothetical protein VFX19_01135 [Dehalococcoidia bacterium]|nr:hypothetical protein [Dehalococcoidia bacterium]